MCLSTETVVSRIGFPCPFLVCCQMLMTLPVIACVHAPSPLLLPLAQFGLPLLLACTSAIFFQLGA